MTAPSLEASRMSGMTAVTLKGLWANKSRFGLSSLAVIISVAFLTAMLILTSQLAGTASDDIAEAYSGIDAVVLGEELGEAMAGPGGGLAVRSAIDSSAVDQLLAVDGVDSAVGIRTGSVQLLDADGGLISTGAQTTTGETWVAQPTLSTFALVDGTAPTTGIVIDRLTAEETSLVVGDEVQVLTEAGTAVLAVEGIATYGAADNAPSTATILFGADSQLLGTAGFDRVVIELTAGAEVIGIANAVSEVDVMTGAAYVVDLQDVVASEASFRTTFLLAFAFIALIAGTTIIYNTFVIAVAQRTRELALLRSIGASRAQVLKSVMGEAAVIGVVASMVGAIVGVGAAYGLIALFEAIGLDFGTGALVVTVDSLLIGFAVGLVVTLMSAFVPARKAADTPPIAALRDAAVDPSGVSRTRNRIATVLLVAGTASAIAGAAAGAWVPAVGGVLVAFIGVIVGGPMVSGWFASVAAGPLERLGGTVGRLAGTNAARNPRRSASTALALTLGVALIAFFTVVASSLSGTAASDTDAALSADQVITPLAASGGPAMPTYLAGSVADGIEIGDGVTSVAAVASTIVVVNGDSAFAAGVFVDQLETVYDLDVVAGSLDDVSNSAIAVHVDAGEGMAVGDELTVMFPESGPVSVTIAALYETDLPGQIPARYVFDEAAFTAASPDAGDALILVATDGSTAALAALDASVPQGAVLQSADEYVDSLGSAVDTFRNFVYALLGAAVIIAVVGIANTTVMAIGERTKEIGMLRAVGMTAKQVRQMVRNEAMLLSAQGSLVGLVLGVGGAYATFSALADGQITLVLPTTSLLVIAFAAAASGVMAAAWPAWRASRMAPLEAIAS